MLCERSFVLMELKRESEAFADVKRGLAKARESRYCMARVVWHAGRIQDTGEAIELLNLVLEVDPHSTDALNQRGWRYQTLGKLDAARADAIRAELAALFASEPRAHWENLLRPTECIWGPLQTPLDLPDDAQVQANGYLLSSPTADGPVSVCANPVQFGGEAPPVRSPAQDAGAQTEEVLLELGCSWEEIGRLKEAGGVS